MDSFGKSDHLKKTEMGPQEINERRTLLAEAAVAVYRQLEDQLPSMRPEIRNVALKAFDRVKSDALPKLDVRYLPVGTSLPEMFAYVARQVVEDVADTVTRIDEFESFATFCHAMIDVAVPQEEYYEMISRTRRRLKADVERD